MAKSFHFRVRGLHRYMGVILGIQFLFWTIGGLYFSWSNMDEVHGDHQRSHIHALSAEIKLVNPQLVLDKIKTKDTVNFVHDIHLIQILGEPVYQISYSNEHDKGKKIRLANAETGKLRTSLTEKEVAEIDKNSYSDTAKISKIE